MSIYKLYLKVYMKVVRFARSRKWLKEPKRTYTYKGYKFSYYKWPTHVSSDGRFYCKPKEVMNSVHFWKTIDKINEKR